MPVIALLADAVVQGPIVRDGPMVRLVIRGRNGRTSSGYALLDTGARLTCVREQALIDVDAPIVGTVSRLTMVGGAMRVHLYDAEASLDGVPLSALRCIGVPEMQHFALVGRDVLSRGTYTHDGKQGRFRLEIA